VRAIAQRLRDHAGLELPSWVVDVRASARIAMLGMAPEDYAPLIASGRGASELAELVESVRVGESRLFRHRPQIDALADVVAPALRARGRRAVRVWSAGCAAGEEPYTLAIVLTRALPDCAISVLATDVSADALAEARAASYPRAALHHVPERYRDAFIDDGERVRVAPDIAGRVQLEQANLVTGPFPQDCDLVWCRNVLIYFTPEARRRTIDRLVAATVVGGFVFVGYSESLRDVPELDGQRTGDAVYYVRRDPTAPARPRRETPAPGLPALATAPSAVSTPARMSRASNDRTPPPVVRATVSDAPTPPSVVRSAAPDDRTPPPILLSAAPPAHDELILRGHPTATRVIAELSARLAQPGLRSLTIDLDGADLIEDDLAPVLRRARAAAHTAGIELAVRATRAGVRRWLVRHGLDGEAA
jgi:chemotaxis protein methyltransferase CheR